MLSFFWLMLSYLCVNVTMREGVHWETPSVLPTTTLRLSNKRVSGSAIRCRDGRNPWHCHYNQHNCTLLSLSFSLSSSTLASSLVSYFSLLSLLFILDRLMVSANIIKLKYMQFQLGQTWKLSCAFLPHGIWHLAYDKRSMYCTWFASNCTFATWVYMLETLRGAVRRL